MSDTKPHFKLGFVEDCNLKFPEFSYTFFSKLQGSKGRNCKKSIITEKCDFGKKL